MVSIVLVSHSKEMSEAVKALAEQQIQGRVAIAAVGGSDNKAACADYDFLNIDKISIRIVDAKNFFDCHGCSSFN